MTPMPLAVALLVLGAAAAPAAVPGGELALRQALHAASVDVEPAGCAGVLAESRQLVLTARHCVTGEGRAVQVRLSTGVSRTAWIVAIDEAADQAALFLEDPVPIEPLVLARRRQIPGTVLYFEGHPSRPRFQTARLERIARCSSLPDLPNALFTDIQGRPGDSGAPLIDSAARVVGLVHGGAHCHIATPADALGRLVERVLERDAVQAARGPVTPGASRRAASRSGRALGAVEAVRMEGGRPAEAEAVHGVSRREEDLHGVRVGAERVA